MFALPALAEATDRVVVLPMYGQPESRIAELNTKGENT